MDLVQCPVCTLYLREGITLETHLDTHPKDQVIRALCALSQSRSSFDSGVSSATSSPSPVPSTTASVFGVNISPRPQFNFISPKLELQSQSSSSSSSLCSLRALPFVRQSFTVPNVQKIISTPSQPRVITPTIAQIIPDHSTVRPLAAFRNVTVLDTPNSIPINTETSPRIRSRESANRFITAKPLGLKILSDVKITSRRNSPYLNGDETILPDLEGDVRTINAGSRTPRSRPVVQNSFSVIKNVGNPSSFVASSPSPKLSVIPERHVLPDLTCNERPSISPCSELADDSSESSFKRGNRISADLGNSRISSIENNPSPSSLKITHSTGKTIIPTSARIEDRSNSVYANINIPRNTFPFCGDGFFKEVNKIKSGPVSPSFYHSTDNCMPSGVEFKSYSSILPHPPYYETKQNSLSCYDDSKVEKNHMNEDSKNNFTSPSENLPEVQPVNVIAFGSTVSNDSDANNTVHKKSSIEKITCNETDEDCSRDGLVYSKGIVRKKFISVDESITINNFQKIEIDNTEETHKNRFSWTQSTQKEEYVLSDLVQCTYGSETCIDDKDQIQSNQSSVSSKNYTLSICSSDNYADQDIKESFTSKLKPKKNIISEEPFVIRANECIPSKGEISEQESNGDVDTSWMYRDTGGSSSYSLLARERWESDGSDVDMPPSPQKSIKENEIEDMPIVVSVKPPDKNYKCATCGKAFNCPKERRVHRTREHPMTNNINAEKKIKQKQIFIKTNIQIKTEKTVKVECLTSTTPTKINETEQESDIKITNANIIDLNIIKSQVDTKDIELVDKKPTLIYIKEEIRRRRQLSCAICKTEFHSEFLFNEHLAIHPLECLQCGKYFRRRANLQLHMKRHLGIKNYKCDICEKRFITKQKMLEHYNIHTGNTPYKCNFCELSFRRHSNMVAHRNFHHLKIKRRVRDYICNCGEVFHSKKKLAWHKEIHDDKPKACLHCNEKFIHSASLTRHIRRAHNNYFVPDEKRKEENVQCPHCNNIYLKSTIEMHIKTHTGNKPYPCMICNKSFTTKWNLKLHKWTHANRSTKPYKCSLCKSAFIRQSDYTSHMNSHKSVRPYTCNYCGCQFIRKYNCQRHVKEHENEKKFICEVPDCGKSFHRSYYLTEHLRVHSGVRPYCCNICGKTSGSKSNHNQHVKIHHAREPVTTEG